MHPTPLALRPRVAPSTAVAEQLLAAVFGPGAARPTGALGASREAAGHFRGAPVRVLFELTRTPRAGTQPFTPVDVEVDLDVAAFSGGAGAPYPGHEAFVVFTPPELRSLAMAGAPRALLASVATGPAAPRLAMTGVELVRIGADALRDGCRTRGARLVVGGWPGDERTLVFLLETALQLADDARRALREAPGRHPEVVAYEAARARSRATGIKIAVAAIAIVVLITGLTVALIVVSVVLR